MDCCYNGMGATIQPMAAVYLERARGRAWRALAISDARLIRRNYLYSLAPARFSTAGAVVATELKETAQRLIESGEWSGVEAVGATRRATPAAAPARRRGSPPQA